MTTTNFVVSAEILPIDVFHHFDLYLEDLISFSQTSKYFYRGIKNSKIKIKKLVTIFDDSLIKWFPFLDNAKIDRAYKNIQKYIHLFSKVHTLNLSYTQVVDVSALGKGTVYDLDLSGTKVVDVSSLGKVHTLILRDTEVVDVSSLGNVHTLDLTRTKILDVSALGKVHTLNLSHTNIIDVSALGNVHTLNLTRTNIIDVSALGNVHTFILYDTKVVDFSALGNVHALYR